MPLAPLALAALILFAAPTAAGDEVAYQLDYVAPSACPSARDFEDRVAAHTTRARAAAPGEAARAFSIVITADAGGARATFRVRDQDGAVSARDVPGRDCAEVVRALALVMALVIDPNAIPEPRVTAPAPPAAPAPISPAPLSPVAADASEEGAAVSPRIGLGVQAGVLVEGIAPGASVLVGAGIELAVPGDDWLAPSFRLSGYWAASADVETKYGAAGFEGALARLHACPIRLPASRETSARACALVDAGQVAGRGFRTTDPGEASVLWLAFGGAVRAETLIWDVLALDLEVGAVVPLSRDRFYFEGTSEVTAHTIGFGFHSLVGVGARFP